MSTFDVIPAIDLRAGRVVRLRQGDFAREDVFSDNPAEVATGFVAAGALWIHVVDLDGAKEGRALQTDVVEAIAIAAGDGVALQVAGGLRTGASVEAAFAAGASRVVIGTAALRDPKFVSGLVTAHGPDRIAVALDIRDGQAVGEGWVAGGTSMPFQATLESLVEVGVRTFIVTAIARDGLLEGPDLPLLTTVAATPRIGVIASGGISSPADLEAVRSIGCVGAIVGRAVYEGRVDLAEAIRALGS
jgi:phosphoribosylformimino-5-aminoimidazole carboxamide ribotide isomerase